ncbi:Putative esterase [Ruminococcaceae bacterium YRB3002]|nr:Putative esterase [Ruminococcaceae bacterium YRB3002]
MTVSVLASLTACAGATETEQTDGTENTVLVNHMTPREIEESKETEFQLLDKPWENASGGTDSNPYAGYKDKILLGSEYGAIIHGNPVFNALPPKDYDGGSGTVVFQHFNMDSGEIAEEEIVFSDYEDLKIKLRAEFDEEIANGVPAVPIDNDYADLISLYDAVIAGNVEIISQDDLKQYMEYFYENAGAEDEEVQYWEMDDSKVAVIRDNISEYHIYDEELDIRFVVHVTTPPSYDADKAYPALVMTDAVWRFNDVPALYEAMANGQADPQLLITIGFEYDMASWDNEVRGNILCDHKKEFLDFITDNLMPYLSEKYRFDSSGSTLFGHSQGGVFTHYAAFNFDRYENRPFARYIIASPTFWTPYFTDVSDYGEYKNEYGYFDRNTTYDRELFIAAGDQEDADYQEYYGDNDSTLEGVDHLKERLDGHGVTTYQVKIYSSHHYQYVGQMLLEYVKGSVA